ncbi:MAG TPA: ABC transporter permease [Verrucomicrobiales bacterium]|nr:ABC transporter permease [Verrucomicrobiales bacterium]
MTQTQSTRRSVRILRRIVASEYLVLFLCLAWFAVLAPVAPGFATPRNLTNILAALLPLLVVATGQTMVLITGGIDLSVTSIIALASVAGSALVTGAGGLLDASPLAVPAGILTMLAVGAGVGLLNGTCVAILRMPPFMVTLATMMFFSGLAIWSTQSRSIHDLPPGLLLAGGNVWISAAVALTVALAAHLVLRRTLLGRWIHAAGQNPKAALVSGVPLQRTLILSYLICGLAAGVAALLITGRLETGSPVHGRSQLLDIIGAVVIGGTSLYGGRGAVAWTAGGVLFLTLIDNSLNLLSLSHFAIMMVKGAVILFAAFLDTLRSRLTTGT